MVELDVKIEAGDLYDYMLMHHYNSASGLLGSCVGGLAVVVGIIKGQPIFWILGAVLVLYLPWTLFLKSRQQTVNNPVFKRKLHYLLDEQGITVSQGDASEHQAWSDMVKAVSTGRSIIVYTSKNNATIFPRKQMGDKETAVIQTICSNMNPKKVKIRN